MRQREVEQVEEALRQGGWFGSDTKAFRAAVVMILGLARRKHLDDFCKLTGYPRADIQKWMRRLRKYGYWRSEDKMTWANWHEEYGQMAFILDVGVVVGELEVTHDENGERLYGESTQS